MKNDIFIKHSQKLFILFGSFLLLIFNRVYFISFLPGWIYEVVQYFSIILLISASMLIYFGVWKTSRRSSIRLLHGVTKDVNYEHIAITFILEEVRCILFSGKINNVTTGDEIQAAGQVVDDSMNIYYLYNITSGKIIKTSIWVYIISFFLLTVIIYLIVFVEFSVVQIDLPYKIVLLSLLLPMTAYIFMLVFRKLESYKMIKNIYKKG